MQRLEGARHLPEGGLQRPAGVLDSQADGLLLLRLEQSSAPHVLEVDADEIQVFARGPFAGLELDRLALAIGLRIVFLHVLNEAAPAKCLRLFLFEQAVGRQHDARVV
jgi:hypothetical protein